MKGEQFLDEKGENYQPGQAKGINRFTCQRLSVFQILRPSTKKALKPEAGIRADVSFLIRLLPLGPVSNNHDLDDTDCSDVVLRNRDVYGGRHGQQTPAPKSDIIR